MKYVLVVFLLLLLSTVHAKYLGILSVLSLENALGKNVVIVQYSLLLALAIWILLQCYSSKEGLSPAIDISSSGMTLGEEIREEEEAEEVGNENMTYQPLDINFAPSENTSDIIDQQTLTQGLTVDNVTPKPIYYEPGTVKYGGLGYVPSYADVKHYSHAKFHSKPDTVASSPGFCNQKDNIMIDMDEKCNTLSSDVCASTGCCVEMSGKCIHGNEYGPMNKKIYSDKTVKNNDAYYYMNKCYGNCQ